MTLAVPHYQVGDADVLVALTRERGHNEELRALVGDQADVLELPLTATRFRPPRDVDRDIRSLDHYGEFRSLVVTSARCERYVALAHEACITAPDVFSVGPATSEVLERLGLKVTRESSGTARDLAEFITEGPVLMLAAAGGRVELSEALAARSLHPYRVECYSTSSVDLDDGEREQLRSARVVFIGAPSAWRVARTIVDDGAWVLVPGVTTLAAVRSDHHRVLVGWGEDFADAWREVVSSNA